MSLMSQHPPDIRHVVVHAARAEARADGSYVVEAEHVQLALADQEGYDGAAAADLRPPRAAGLTLRAASAPEPVACRCPPPVPIARPRLAPP